jgi:hypothetical protein
MTFEINMRQLRLTHFFPLNEKPVTASKLHLLDLPHHIRYQIYDELGLGRKQLINLNCLGTWGTKLDHDDESGSDERLAYLQQQAFANGRRHHLSAKSLPFRLLLVSRVVHDEVTRIIYGRNHFFISKRDSGALQRLEIMGTAALNALRVITIHLNICSCTVACCNLPENFRRCGNFWECASDRKHDKPLGMVSRSDRATISQWTKICARLAAHAQPRKLHLYLICDCLELETAKAVVAPLAQLPVLLDCAIRLGKVYNADIQQLARATVLSLTGRQQKISAPFRFLYLPQEIQLKILEYTTLVSHDRLEWTSSKLLLHDHCTTFGSTRANDGGEPWPMEPWAFRCFCAQSHSAFSFNCVYIPGILTHFLVSRRFRAMAMQVFYSKNRFAILPSHQTYFQLVDHYEGLGCMPIYPFLKYLSPAPIALLTSLTLVIPPIEPTHPSPTQAAWGPWEEWLYAIDMLARVANLKALNLEIHITDFTWKRWKEQEAGQYDGEYEAEMLEAYRRLIEPLGALRGLRNLFIHLTWSIHESRQDQRTQQEDNLEKFVMGKNYDAQKNGKKVTGFKVRNSVMTVYSTNNWRINGYVGVNHALAHFLLATS